ncbi:MAG: caspase family protein [Chlamydiota bacterium]|nr:caspase family protein [Chlamydiota bacterium]
MKSTPIIFRRTFAVAFLFILSCSIFLGKVDAANLHSIIIGDTTAYQIGFSVEADINTIRNEMNTIATHTDLTLKEKIFSGRDVNSDILQWLKDTNIESDDVVFIFFSGHGYRTHSKTENIWPNLFLTPENVGIDFHDVTKIIEEKNPRLMLAIADCCNNVLPDEHAPPLIKRSKHFLSYVKPDVQNNYYQLFLNTTGSIKVSSSMPGDFAWGTRKGGLYTVALIDSLKSEVETSFNPEWSVILERASMTVINRNVGQTPQFELSVN